MRLSWQGLAGKSSAPSRRPCMSRMQQAPNGHWCRGLIPRSPAAAALRTHCSSSLNNNGADCNQTPQQQQSSRPHRSGRHSSDDEPADLYPLDDEQQCCNRIQNAEQQTGEALRSISGWDADGLPQHHTSRRGVSNQVQLSVYPDAIGDNLADLTAFLNTEVQDAIGGIHLLPLFPSSGDRGFAPITYQQIDPEFGSWADVQQLSIKYQLCLEFMTNHISPASQEFQDYLQHGDASPFKDMFVHWHDIWPQGPSADELAKIRTRKPAPPVIGVKLPDGRVEPLWCTFSDQQIDIDPFSDKGWQFVESSLRSLCEKGGAKLLRLDAFGYVTKKAGTSCFMLEPEVWELLQRIKQVVKPYGTQLLCEVHEDFQLNIELARHGFWVYDFALPLLILHALRFQTAEPLKMWLSICPRRQITTLDTHDGMGVDDVTGLAPLVDIQEVEKCIVQNGGNINYKHFYIPGGQFESEAKDGSCSTCKRSVQCLYDAADFLQPDALQGCYKSTPHQYNETYFSAVKEDPQMYLLARAVQFFTPGVPMVYYVGLLAGRDDVQRVEQTGSVREINRHAYSLQEARQAVRRPVVQALLQLCRFRNTHPAFKGRVFVDDATPAHKLHVRWYTPDHWTTLDVDMRSRNFKISYTAYQDDATDGALQNSPYLSIDSAGGSGMFCTDVLDLPSRAAIRHKIERAAVTAAAATLAADGGTSLDDVVAAGSAGDGDGASVPGTGNGNGSSGGSDGRGGNSNGSTDSKRVAVGPEAHVVRASRTMSPEAASDAGVLHMERLVSETVEDVKDDGAVNGSTGQTAQSEAETAGAEAAVGSGNGSRAVQQLDLSWAWQLPDKGQAASARVAAGDAVARAG